MVLLFSESWVLTAATPAPRQRTKRLEFKRSCFAVRSCRGRSAQPAGPQCGEKGVNFWQCKLKHCVARTPKVQTGPCIGVMARWASSPSGANRCKPILMCARGGGQMFSDEYARQRRRSKRVQIGLKNGPRPPNINPHDFRRGVKEPNPRHGKTQVPIRNCTQKAHMCTSCV